MKYPLLTSLFLLWTSAFCQSPQEKQGSTDEKLFREYCLMNATETYDFALPGSLTVEDLQGTPVRIDSLAKEDKLILRIRGSFCEDCVLAEIKQINSLKDCSHIAIIATYDNLRMLKIAVEKYGIKVPVYHLTNGVGQELFSRNDKKGIPYLFLLRHQTLQCESTFFPSKLFPDFSASYYETMTGYLAREDKKHTLFTFTNKDLGTVERGKTYEVEFDYRNTKDSLLVIHDVRHSCDCVVPQWKNAPLRKGESGKLTVRFTPKGHGYSMQSVMVYHNQSRYPSRLTIRAEAK